MIVVVPRDFLMDINSELLFSGLGIRRVPATVSKDRLRQQGTFRRAASAALTLREEDYRKPRG
jgi:hypothetical protein